MFTTDPMYRYKIMVAKVTLIRYVDTSLFYVFPGILKRISISICKLRNYLDCVTSKGKEPQILDVCSFAIIILEVLFIADTGWSLQILFHITILVAGYPKMDPS